MRHDGDDMMATKVIRMMDSQRWSHGQ